MKTLRFHVRMSYVFGVAAIDVHLSQSVMRKHEIGGSELSRLIVVLERLVVVALNVKRSCQLIATFRSHRFIFGVVEGMQRQMLHLLVVLFEEEMIGEMIQHHWIGRVDGVRLGQHLYAEPIGFRFV